MGFTDGVAAIFIAAATQALKMVQEVPHLFLSIWGIECMQSASETNSVRQSSVHGCIGAQQVNQRPRDPIYYFPDMPIVL